MMARGGQCFEKLRRFARTVFFVAALVASLLVTSLPVLVAVVDVLVPCVLISSFTCVKCYGFKEHLRRYAFKSSLTDIPLVSVIRSFIIICTIRYSSPFYLHRVSRRTTTTMILFNGSLVVLLMLHSSNCFIFLVFLLKLTVLKVDDTLVNSSTEPCVRYFALFYLHISAR